MVERRKRKEEGVEKKKGKWGGGIEK